jgi:hypothetical protein
LLLSGSSAITSVRAGAVFVLVTLLELYDALL